MFFSKEGCGCGHHGEEHHCRHEFGEGSHCHHEHGEHGMGCHHGDGCHGEGHHHCHREENNDDEQGCYGHGGRREGAGRKKNCERIPFNRRLSEESINLIKDYAAKNNITETEALERAIQSLK